MTKVSVCMITYNHERFIRQAIESALDQQTSFSFKVVIGEDCSTDHTREIASKYESQVPGMVVLLPSNQNFGINKNLARTLQACEGDYIALLEGDDWWTTASKLQKQVDYLDAHPECAICFHPVAVYDDTTEAYRGKIPGFRPKPVSTIVDLLTEGNYIPTCSAVFRRGLFLDFPAWYYELRIGDYPLHVLNAQHGKIGYLNEVMGAYRLHAGGTWSAGSNSASALEAIRTYDYLNAELEFRYDKIIRMTQNHWKASELIKNGNITACRSLAVENFKISAFSKHTLATLLMGYLSPIYRYLQIRRMRR